MSSAYLSDTAVVTGAGRGIGAAVSKLLAVKGVKVLMVARTATELESTAADIRSQVPGAKIATLAVDVSDLTQLPLIFETAAKLGPPTILVNNAAIVVIEEILNSKQADFDRTMNVNVRAPWALSVEFLRRAASHKSAGTIVNVSSLGGIRGTQKFPGMAAYVVSKHAIVGLTEAIAVEAAPFGVSAYCVAPGAVDTRMLKEAAPFLKTNTKPEDVAKVIVELCDRNATRPISGTVIELHTNA